MCNYLRYALIAILCASVTDAFAQSKDLENYIEKQANLLNIPALSYAVTGPDSTHVIGTAGRDKDAYNEHTLYRIGSVTKTFTAFAVAVLVDDGKINYDDAIEIHLPDFQIKTEQSRSITIRQLLTHTSGFSQWSGHDLTAQRKAKFEHIELANPPGKSFEYSSLNYIILGQIIEQVAGQSYEDYLRNKLFEPTGMNSCTTDLSVAQTKGLAQGHRYLFGLTMPHTPSDPPQALIPAGYLACNAKDLTKYLRLIMNRGVVDDTVVISSERIDEMLTPWNNKSSGAGMGWGIGPTTIGHSGNTQGFSARVSMLPKDSLGIVLLSSVNSGPLFSGLEQIMTGTISLIRDEQNISTFPKELAFKIGIFLLMLMGIIKMVVKLKEWIQAGFPIGISWNRKAIKPIIIELAIAIVVLYFVPHWLGVPLRVIIEYSFDLGLVMVVGVATGLISAFIKSFIISHEIA